MGFCFLTTDILPFYYVHQYGSAPNIIFKLIFENNRSLIKICCTKIFRSWELITFACLGIFVTNIPNVAIVDQKESYLVNDISPEK